MRGLLRLLARLYPAEWRKRYGAEYEALLDEGKPRVRDVFDVVWGAFKMQMTTVSFVRIMLVCSLAGALGAVGLSFMAPRKYLSQTLISVEMPEHQAIDRYLAGLMKDWLSPEFLISIIERENLYSGERARMPMSGAVDLMRKGIWIAPVKTRDGKTAFTIAFTYPDPHVAQRVDMELTSQFMLSALQTAIKNSSDPSRIPMTFRAQVAANLPQSPIFPKRGLFGAGGLIAGLGGGLVLAGLARRRRLTGAAI